MSGDPTYRGTGVNVAAREAWLAALREREPAIGGFAGVYPIGPLVRGMKDPCLASCADGVGTKMLVARAVGDFSTVGRDCVAMVLNDLVCCGARPLFLIDYIATGKFDAAQADAIIEGVRSACREAGCDLLGGETAELPDLIREGDADLCCFATGIVERSAVITGNNVRAGDIVIGLPSSGIHANGLSLARAILPEYTSDAAVARLLLEPTWLYVRPVQDVLARHRVAAIAHITGGGIPGNLRRVLPGGCGATLDSSLWELPEVFARIGERGPVDREEMFGVFNMGIGMCLVAAPDEADAVTKTLDPYNARRIGTIVEGDKRVTIDGTAFD